MAALLRGCSTSLQRLSVGAQLEASHSAAGQAPVCLLRIAKPEVWELAGLRKIWKDWKRSAFASEDRPRGKLIARAVAAERSSRIPQNEDLAPVLPKNKKRPYVGGPPKRGKGRLKEKAILMSKPPNNGLLVKKLIPVAYRVMMARATLVEGVARLMKVYPVKACRYCGHVHVGPTGHLIKDCRGARATRRSGQHEWLDGEETDVVPAVETYHLVDVFGRPVSHEERFDVERIPAVVELCIQAGVELPGYPTVRRTRPIDRRERYKTFASLPMDWPGVGPKDHGRTYADWAAIDAPEAAPQKGEPNLATDVDSSSSNGADSDPGNVEAEWEDDFSEMEDEDGDGNEDEVISSMSIEEEEASSDEENAAGLAECISDDDDLKTIAEKTVRAWEEMKFGCQKLMTKYRVRACGYCPEIQVGQRGHRARNCGAFKHQWRNGQHGWQAASLDDLIPPQYVWHVVDHRNPLLTNDFRKFYGQAPAVIELCHQAGADIPEVYKPRMRLDVVIPDLREMDLAC